jgi:RNA polymerase sigma-70 factor (ECF subfamily)
MSTALPLLRSRPSAARIPTPLQVSSLEGEAALLRRLRAGDESSFEELVRSTSGRMLATARRLLGSEEEARDAVQEAFLAAWRGLPNFEGGARIASWLHRIVVNAALMRLRSRRRRSETSLEELLPRFEPDGRRIGPTAQRETRADDALARKQLRSRVRAAIHRLPEPYRSVLLLRDVEELDTEEVASLMGVTPGCVKTRLHRARQALMTLLAQELG